MQNWVMLLLLVTNVVSKLTLKTFQWLDLGGATFVLFKQTFSGSFNAIYRTWQNKPVKNVPRRRAYSTTPAVYKIQSTLSFHSRRNINVKRLFVLHLAVWVSSL